MLFNSRDTIAPLTSNSVDAVQKSKTPYTLIIHARLRKMIRTRSIPRLVRRRRSFWASPGTEWVEITQSARGIARVLALIRCTISAGVSVVSTLSACCVYPRNRWFDATRHMTDKPAVAALRGNVIILCCSIEIGDLCGS